MSIEEIYQRFKNSNKVCTDTRKLESGDLFFALKGDNFNGNQFALKALDAGASCVVIDDAAYNRAPGCILVEDVLQTLQQLANYHRKTFQIPVIGLTGSSGKTTNKELLRVVLSRHYKVHATAGNLNNHIGVPLTLLAMPDDTEIAIIEMGASHQKEIESLCQIAEPTHGFITNIGKAHLEGFGGIEGVKKGKGELYDFLKAGGGYAFVNSTDDKLMQMVKEREMLLTVFYGNDERALTLLAETPEVKFQEPETGGIYTAQLSGGYNFDNIQTAFAIGRFFNVNITAACEALASYAPDNNRSQKIEQGSNTIFMDAYNANPSSMEASVKNFWALKTNKGKVLILGDMFELGEYSQAEHENIGRLVSEMDFDTIVLYGHEMRHALAFLPKAYYFTDKFSLHNWVADKHFNNSAILIKASRSVGLETIVNVLDKT